MERKVERRTELTLPSDTEILLKRDFRAKRTNVFDAWAKPEWVKHWYGCETQAMTRCEIDFREGGKWRWGLHDPSNGIDHIYSGEYRQIVRPERLVFTERYEAVPGSDHVVALDFQEQSGVTTLTMRIIHESKFARDMHMKVGIESGIEQSFDRLERWVTSAANDAA